MADTDELDGTTDPETNPEDQGQEFDQQEESQPESQPGFVERGARYFSSQARQSPTAKAVQKSPAATKAIEKGVQGALTQVGEKTAARFAFAAFGPEIIAGILIFLAIGATVASLFFIICSYNGCNGSNAGDPKSTPANNKVDALEMQTAKCLDKAAKLNDKGDGPVPKECIAPIKGWSQMAIDSANRMLPKVPKPESAEGQAAIKILNEMLAAAKEANGVSAQTTVKTALEQRKRLEDALSAANANAIIQKLLGISENMKKVIAYIQKNNPKQQFNWDCYETDNTILQKTFNVNHATAFAGPELPGYDTSGAPTSEAIEATKKALRDGGIPIWFIRGSFSGQHYIIILNIDESNNIFYYDPAGGGTHSDPSTWAGTGKNKFFFGSPLPPFKSGNKAMRGYVFQP